MEVTSKWWSRSAKYSCRGNAPANDNAKALFWLLIAFSRCTKSHAKMYNASKLSLCKRYLSVKNAFCLFVTFLLLFFDANTVTLTFSWPKIWKPNEVPVSSYGASISMQCVIEKCVLWWWNVPENKSLRLATDTVESRVILCTAFLLGDALHAINLSGNWTLALCVRRAPVAEV